MEKIFVFSGLGADKRVFVNLKIDGFELVHLNWIKPLENEPIEVYARRIAASIDEAHPILMGLSFGGLMAAEVNKFLPAQKLILISTAKTKHEFAFYIKLVRYFQLHKLFPYSILKYLRLINNYVFNATTKEQKMMLRKIIDESDAELINWSIDKVVNWQNETEPKNYLHLHGTTDIIFPASKIKNARFINDGGHLMVLNRAAEISTLINSFLKS